MPAKKMTTKETKGAVSKRKTVKSKIAKTREMTEFSNFSMNFSGLKSRLSKNYTYWLLGIVIVGAGLFLLGKYLIVAWVDNKPITRIELYSNLEKRYGKDMKEELIIEKLLTSEAAKRKVSVSKTDLDQEVAKVETQQGGKDQLNQILQAQNISQDNFQRIIQLQLLKQKMFSEGVSVSDDDVKKFMDEKKDTMPVATNSAEQAKLTESIKEQLKQEKISTSFNQWLTEALKSSRVVRS